MPVTPLTGGRGRAPAAARRPARQRPRSPRRTAAPRGRCRGPRRRPVAEQRPVLDAAAVRQPPAEACGPARRRTPPRPARRSGSGACARRAARRAPPPRAGRRRPARARDARRPTPGRQEVREVVGAGGRPAEALVARRAVADHRVERVDRAVRQQPRHAAERAPDSGPTTASEVFSATDSTVARASPPVEPGRVAPAQVAEPLPGTSRSPGSSRRDISYASRRRLVPPTTAQVASAVTPARGTDAGNARDRPDAQRRGRRPSGRGRTPCRPARESRCTTRSAAAATGRSRRPGARAAGRRAGGQRRHRRPDLPRRATEASRRPRGRATGTRRSYGDASRSGTAGSPARPARSARTSSDTVSAASTPPSTSSPAMRYDAVRKPGAKRSGSW